MIQAAVGRNCAVYLRNQHGRLTFGGILNVRGNGQVQTFSTTVQRRQKEELLVRLIGHYNKAKLIFDKRRVDVVPEGFSLIYRSPLERYIVYSHLGCMLIAVGFTGLVAYSLVTGSQLYSEDGTFEDKYQVATGVLFLAAIISLVQVIQLRSPLRMYFSDKEKKFISVFGTWIPLATRRIIMKPGQVKSAGYHSLVVPWAPALHTFSNADVSGKKLILFSYSFRYPVYYNRLLGFQK